MIGSGAGAWVDREAGQLNVPGPIRRSIGLMQATVLLLATLGIALALSAVQLSIAAGQHRGAARARTEDVLTLAEGGATRAAWTLDQELAARVLGGVLATGGFRAARLVDERGEVLAAIRHYDAPRDPLSSRIREWLFRDVLRGERRLTLTVAGRSQFVGMLEVEQEPHALAAGFIRQAQGAVLASLVESLLVGLMLLWISSRLVTSHLHRAAVQLADARPERSDVFRLPVPAVHRDNELGDLLRSTNRMIARLQDSRRELAHVATHDPLTGLPNRLLIRDQLEGALSRARRSGTRVAVLFLDLDRFKAVNDLHGHECGDALLQAIAGALSTAVRDADAVGRLSGDEFLVVGEGIESEDEVVQLVRRVVDAASRRHPLGEREVSATVSVGVAIFPADGEDADALIRNADLAMYRAKRDSGSVWRFYSDEMGGRAAQRVRLEADLALARGRGELELHYQPRYATGTGVIQGCEALVRWRRGGRLVNAARFIALAEDSGLILDIGDFVLDEACRQAAAWNAAGTPLRVAVNISGRQLTDRDLAADVRGALARHGLAPRLLELEVTESVLIGNLERGRALLAGLRDDGVVISVDDFGTGYSSLAYLIGLPAACLKIDRSFVSGPNRSPAVLGMIINMARSLGMRSVAEGVETEAQHAMLCEHGCDEVQGYLLGVPVPASEFAAAFLSGEDARPAVGRRS